MNMKNINTMKKKAYKKPYVLLFSIGHLMQGDGLLQNSGEGYLFGTTSVSADELE